MLKEAMPKNVLENAGFVSEDSFVTHDIGSRLQIALEFILPKVITYSQFHFKLCCAVVFRFDLRIYYT